MTLFHEQTELVSLVTYDFRCSSFSRGLTYMFCSLYIPEFSIFVMSCCRLWILFINFELVPNAFLICTSYLFCMCFFHVCKRLFYFSVCSTGDFQFTYATSQIIRKFEVALTIILFPTPIRSQVPVKLKLHCNGFVKFLSRAILQNAGKSARAQFRREARKHARIGPRREIRPFSVTYSYEAAVEQRQSQRTGPDSGAPFHSKANEYKRLNTINKQRVSVYSCLPRPSVFRRMSARPSGKPETQSLTRQRCQIKL